MPQIALETPGRGSVPPHYPRVAGRPREVQDREAVRALNISGARVPLGSLVKFSTDDDSFVTSTTVGDDEICGITLEDMEDDKEGMVAISGAVEKLRVASGVTRRQFIRQSSTAGVGEGTAAPTKGTHAQARTNRDANGYVKAVILHMHGASTPYDALGLTGVQHTYGLDFGGRLATVASSERYTASGGTTPTFVADATNGQTRVQLTTAATAGAEAVFAFNNTFTPRAAEDWGFKAVFEEITAPNTGTPTNGQHRYAIGFLETLATTSDGIYFRQTSSAGSRGNWLLVCRNAAIETTVDMGVAPSAGTRQLLGFRITGGGTSVQGHINNIATGAAITTNVPTNLLRVACMSAVGDAVESGSSSTLYEWAVQDGF